MIKAPNGHTSIYFTDYLKKNWPDVNKFMSAKGFTSFNGYANHLITDDFNTNYSKTLKQKNVSPDKRIDIYNDTQTIVREKMNAHSDGEELDFYHLVTDLRNTVIRDLKKRGVKL